MTPTIGLHAATENELGVAQRATRRLDGIDLVVRSVSDLDDVSDADAFVDELESTTAVVFWLHGAENNMPGYDHAVERLEVMGVPLVVKATGDVFARRNIIVIDTDRERVCEHLDRGGTVNVENLCRFLIAEYVGVETEVDDPVELPTEGVYRPDYPGIEYDELLDTHDPDKPTIGVWFYEPHWTHANTRYAGVLMERPESLGANVLPALCNPTTDEGGQKSAEWVTWNRFSDDGGPVVDAVVSSFMFSLSTSGRGRDADDEGSVAEDVFLTELGVPVL